MANNGVIPVVDLSQFLEGSSGQRNGFVKKLGDAFHNIGFVGVANHGISQDLINDFYMSSKAFFGLSVEVKKKYEIPELAGQRGYTSFGTERAKGYDAVDLKEFFQFGQEVEYSNSSEEAYANVENVAELPQFSKKGRQLYKAFEKVGSHLLRAIALHLELGEDYFESQTRDGLSILRAIHYPPITEEPKSSIRAEQHEDINLITLLVGASAGGLQFMDKNNEWKAIEPEEDEIVLNVGDMLQRLTNNYLKSTTHRVVNPPREEWHKPRLSIPFFMHPVASMDLTCLEKCVTDENPLQFEAMTAGEYLDQRLREIGLKK